MYSTASVNTQMQAEFYSTHQIDNTVTTIMNPLRGGVQSIDTDDQHTLEELSMTTV